MSKVARVILFAKEMTKMVEFYRDVVGLSVLPSNDPDWQEFDCEGSVFALHGIPEEVAKGVTIEDPPRAREGSPMKICFQSSDVVKSRLALSKAGVPVRDLKQFGELTFFDAVDPEGNIIQMTNR